jgi:succinoglycan biosynthesis protein ExoA
MGFGQRGKIDVRDAIVSASLQPSGMEFAPFTGEKHSSEVAMGAHAMAEIERNEAPEPAPASILAVIPTLNEERHIETCIRSLMRGDAQLRSIPLVVADGGSTDKTVEIVEHLKSEFPNLQLIHNPKKLQAAAMNLAVLDASTPVTQYIVRCDAHSIYPADFILSSQKHSRPRVRLQSSSQWMQLETRVSNAPTHGSLIRRWFRRLGSSWRQDFRLCRPWAPCRLQHHMYRQIGGYDETFSHNEDAEYDERVAQAGGKIFLDSEIRIRYIPRGSVSRLAKQYFNYGKGRARNVRKHGQRLKIRQALPVFALVASAAGFLASPLFLPALILPLGYIGVLATASLAVAVWKWSPCGLLAGLISGTMHMSWAAGFLSEAVAGTRR